MEKRFLAMWMWLCEGKLKDKIAHFRLPSVSQNRVCLSSNGGTVKQQAKRWKKARWTFEVILPHRNLHKSQQITYQNAAN